MLALRATPKPLPRAAGWAVFGVLVVFVAVGTISRAGDDPAQAAIGTAVAVGFGAAAILGRPLWILPAALVGSAGITLVGDGTASNLAWFGLPVLAAWCALSAPLQVTGIYWAAAMVTIGAEALLASPDAGWAAWVGGTCFSVVGCTFGRRQRDLAEQLRAAQAGLAQRAQAEERNRIARELHDVIAHSLTVSLLHVSSARLALDEDRETAVRALEEAERLGRRSLDEVRHAVGLLHRGEDADPTAPLPGSLDLPSLIEGFRSAGADVSSTIDGDLDRLPNTVGLAAYRIVQESLTNAVKHAPGTASTVRVRVRPDSVQVLVESEGTPRRGEGLGLLSMRERAESVGGRCSAGPGGTGWLVRAELPLQPVR
ncbi:MAG: sensor histidine kinase [Jatrophihabitans sp.]|uniref:sensor histidine kinase n=1 Tax=Jatrophihabitans sp. TaxID=1932789 RepID=UPI00390E1489